MEEVWKYIDGFEDYQISNFGRVKSFKNGKEKILRYRKSSNGYLNIQLFKDGKSRTFKIHRLVANAFIDNPNNLSEVNHKDGDKTNNIVDNLEWSTRSHNIKHAFDNGLRKPYPHIGEQNGQHKLTQDDVDEIRRVYIKGDKVFGAKPLARKYNVSKTAIQYIIQNKTWSKQIIKGD